MTASNWAGEEFQDYERKEKQAGMLDLRKATININNLSGKALNPTQVRLGLRSLITQ